jgi:hypothetical protein
MIEVLIWTYTIIAPLAFIGWMDWHYINKDEVFASFIMAVLWPLITVILLFKYLLRWGE